jgi:hypothetical protein
MTFTVFLYVEATFSFFLNFMLSIMSQDCPFLIAPLVFFNVYLPCILYHVVNVSGLSVLDFPFGFLIPI